MNLSFWVRRFITVAAALFLTIGSVQLLKGHPLVEAAWLGLFWSLVAASVFTISRFFQARRGQHCALCNDIPEAAEVPAHDPTRLDREASAPSPTPTTQPTIRNSQ